MTPAGAAQRLRMDAAMTADRDEIKHLVDAATARAIAGAIAAWLPSHRFDAAAAAGQSITTIYFDTPARDLYRAACTAATAVKVRAKEYHPAGAGAGAATEPRLVMEVKRGQGNRTTKSRVELARGEVLAFLGAAQPSLCPSSRTRTAEPASAELLAALSSVTSGLSLPLGADSMVHYRRLAWQDEAGTLRVTLDLEVAFFAPPADLLDPAASPQPLARPMLGAPAALERHCVLEVKSRGELPGWLRELLAAAGACASPYSKFLAASAAVHAIAASPRDLPSTGLERNR